MKFWLSGWLSGCLSVITSTFPIQGLQIIPESCQTPHIIHRRKEENPTVHADTRKTITKTKTKTQTKTKTKYKKNPTCAIFLKSTGRKGVEYDILMIMKKTKTKTRSKTKTKTKTKTNTKYK